MIETVAINFKKSGQKAFINNADFDPKTHTLWTEGDEKRDKAPLPAPKVVEASEKTINEVVQATQPAAPARAAKTRKA